MTKPNVPHVEYGVRFTATCGSHVTHFGTDRAGAERIARVERAGTQRIELVSREVGAWAVAPPSPPSSVDEGNTPDGR